MMIPERPPEFAANGTFLWNGLGYRFSGPPPVNLRSQEALSATDPWIVLTAALERAKAGDHSALQLVRRWVLPESPPLLNAAILDLFADAGSSRDLQALASYVSEGPDDIRVHACWSVPHSGMLSIVPAMLEAWHAVPRRQDQESICVPLSDMLEEEAGQIADDAGLTAEEYDKLVRSALETLRSSLGSDRIPVWRGRIFGVRRIAEEMWAILQNLEEESALTGQFMPLRHRFEASTGIDCSGFFHNGRFRPLAAAATIERFLDSAEAAKYKDGVRYFFGHPVPD